MKIATAAIYLLLSAGGALAATLSPIEERLVASIDVREPAAVELIEKVVAINSGTLNLVGVREVGKVFEAELRALGFTTHWVEGQSFERAGHLVAIREGEGPGVLLIGHLDTVFEPESPFQSLEWLGEHELRGPGITDMKGGVVVMLEALRALSAQGLLDLLDLRVVLTGDEEKPGHPLEVSRKALVEAAEGAHWALGFEDGDGNPGTAVVARRGSSRWKLTVRGKPAHSSQVFSEAVGYGAIYEVSRILSEFRVKLSDEQYLTFNPGVLLAGTEVELDSPRGRGSAFGKTNVVAEHAVVEGDLRAVSPEQLERARSIMGEIVASSLPGTSAQIDFTDGYPPMAPNEDNHRLLELYDQVSRDLGFGEVTAVHPLDAGAADVSFIAEPVPMVLDGLGLMGRGGHTAEETADMKTLGQQIKRTAVLLARLAISD